MFVCICEKSKLTHIIHFIVVYRSLFIANFQVHKRREIANDYFKRKLTNENSMRRLMNINLCRKSIERSIENIPIQKECEHIFSESRVNTIQFMMTAKRVRKQGFMLFAI